jgi:hypothetical protein
MEVHEGTVLRGSNRRLATRLWTKAPLAEAQESFTQLLREVIAGAAKPNCEGISVFSKGRGSRHIDSMPASSTTDASTFPKENPNTSKPLADLNDGF